MLDARLFALIFFQSLYTLQRGVSAIAEQFVCVFIQIHFLVFQIHEKEQTANPTDCNT